MGGKWGRTQKSWKILIPDFEIPKPERLRTRTRGGKRKRDYQEEDKNLDGKRKKDDQEEDKDLDNGLEEG